MGTRPDDLNRGINSLLAQKDVDIEVVVVGNGWLPVNIPDGITSLELKTNLGIPAGRNAGAGIVSGEYLFFLDDDAALPSSSTLANLISTIGPETNAALVQPRVIDFAGESGPDRWVPRLRTGDHAKSGPATSLWEGGVAIRRETFDQIGGWAPEYFYAHEGIELCWRTWNTGKQVWYAGDISVQHPTINPQRHPEFWFMNARNRVWLAKRNLPIVLVPIYPLTWLVITVLRVRSVKSLKTWLAGFWAGWTKSAGRRDPIKWSTVWALTKAGRPPII